MKRSPRVCAAGSPLAGPAARSSRLAGLAALCMLASAASAQPEPDVGYTPPRTPWGDPDLQGTWPGTATVGVPMQRPERFGIRNWLTDEELAERQAKFRAQSELDPADFDPERAGETRREAIGGPVSTPPHWLERGELQRQASLIVDPPNGRMPPLTEAAERRQQQLRRDREGRGPADSYTDRSLYERCITRGVAGSILPVIYNSGNEIVQAPGYVAIRNEMIHETRVIPLDGRPHVSPDIRMWMGDSRGRWDGDTLVIETRNLTDRTGVGLNGGGPRHSEQLTITERLTRIDEDTIRYELTIDDPQTWTRPWTMSFPLKRDDDYGFFEYACHESNYAMFDILRDARAEEARAARGGPAR
ncbi:MAG: hypothetical protein JXB36_08840 [Gammaproteobacteria bacterium]|nr:hypothetical protein [Gammaproteobacteria bacterium]